MKDNRQLILGFLFGLMGGLFAALIVSSFLEILKIYLQDFPLAAQSWVLLGINLNSVFALWILVIWIVKTFLPKPSQF